MLAELMRKQERAAAAQQAEGGAAAARAARPGKGVQVPALGELFRVGQLVRCVITELQDKEGSGKAASNGVLHGSGHPVPQRDATANFVPHAAAVLQDLIVSPRAGSGQ